MSDIIGFEIADGKILSLVDGHRAMYYVGLDASKSASPGVGDAYLAYDTDRDYICIANGSWAYRPKYQVGLDASKSVSPIVGDIYKASDTLREYVCLSAGTWTFSPQTQNGLDANKSDSPIVGEGYNATDTGKTYTCYVSGYWSITNSVAKTVYYNHGGGGDSVCGSATGGSGTADTTGHMRNLSTQIDQAGFAAYGINIPIYPSSNDFTVNFLVDGISDGSGGTGRQTNIGMTDITGEIPLIAIVCDDTDQWKTYLSDGFAVQSTNISPIQNGDLITIISVRNKSIFLVNGIIVSSYSMGFSPITSVYAIARVQCSSSITTARTVSVDFIGFELMR